MTKRLESGEFFCPGCGGPDRPYTRKAVKRYFTLYFIPLFPTETLAEYVECGSCGGTYKPEVLDFDPAEDARKQAGEYRDHIKRMMILSAVADGDVGPGRRETIRAFHREFSGGELTDAEIDREVSLARNARANPIDYALRFKDGWTEHGKEQVIQAVAAVLRSEGELSPVGRHSLQELASALGLSQAHFKGILLEIEG